MDFEAIFNNMERDRKSKKQEANRGRPTTVGVEKKANPVSEIIPTRYDPVGQFMSEETAPDAASEKDLGNEYFKQKKYHEAIECYSRSIGLSPTAVAFANRAMAYLKIKRFEQAENDCTEALHLDDRYVKAYSRRATARKELGKLKSSMEDSEFAVSLEPNTQELRKQYTETKRLYEKELSLKTSKVPRTTNQGAKEIGSSAVGSKGAKGVELLTGESERPVAAAVQIRNMNHQGLDHKQEIKPSIQDLASRAAARVRAAGSRNLQPPKTAYEFEVSWRALSDDCELQANWLKTIAPETLPKIFKHALSAPILVDIVKCTSSFVREDAEFALSILDNLTRVPRFDMIIMSLSAVDRSGFNRIWDELLSSEGIPEAYLEMLSRLRPKYCYGR